MTLAATTTDVNNGGFWKLALSFRFGEQNRDATNAKDPKILSIQNRIQIWTASAIGQCHLGMVV